MADAAYAEARARFPVLGRLAYLNAGTTGPLSVATHRAMADWERRDLEEGRAGRWRWEEWARLADRLRERLAALLDVAPGQVVLTTSTTEGCNIVVNAFRLQPGDEVVTTDAEHPGLGEPLRASAATVRTAHVLGVTQEEAVAAVLAEVTPRTRLVALSHVLWVNGQVLPIAEIRRGSGVPLLVDGAQSAGAIPADAGAADFYTVSGQKWLCGPELTGALYIGDPDRLRPAVAGHAASHAEGAQRFGVAHHPLAGVAGLLAAMEERPEWAFERAAAMAARCRELLLAAGVDVRTPAGQGGTLVSFAPAPGPAPEAAEAAVLRCQERGVVIRALPDGWLRASCGWWTDEEDLARLVHAVRPD
ncbi:MAG TPA: aminotransferase class V-fold PLP-dependent enzyme [Candidatus Dormibacteraeota bacterium]|nr:aminotransferase class V-fold PLP-dependent enzyme [Candidatus Dormibacteraeota bacterium]